MVERGQPRFTDHTGLRTDWIRLRGIGTKGRTFDLQYFGDVHFRLCRFIAVDCRRFVRNRSGPTLDHPDHFHRQSTAYADVLGTGSIPQPRI